MSLVALNNTNFFSCRSGGPKSVSLGKAKVLAELQSFWRLQGQIQFPAFNLSLEATCIPCHVAPFSIFEACNIASITTLPYPLLQSSHLLLPSYKDTYDYIRANLNNPG